MVLIMISSVASGFILALCSLIIVGYLKKKPLGMQTLFDLILMEGYFFNLLGPWIQIIVINLPTLSHSLTIIAEVLAGKTLFKHIVPELM